MTAILGRTGNLVGFSTGRGTTPWDTEMEAALRKMDAMLASTVVAITNTLPGSANEGDLYLVGTSPTGVAAGWANRIARWRGSPAGWEAYQPMQGWIITIVGESTNKVRRYNGTAWVALAADAGAEPYAGTPAATSFWRSTAAGVRAWVQLVAADITDLATTLAAYLTKLNPTYTGRLTGPTQYLEADEQILLAIRRPGGQSGRVHGIAFQAQNDASAWVEFGRVMTYISSVAAGAHAGGMRLMAYKDGAIVQAADASADAFVVPGTLQGARAIFSEFGTLAAMPGDSNYGTLHAAGVTRTGTNYALRLADSGADTLVNAATNVALAIAGTTKVGVTASEMNLASGVALKMSATTVIDSSRNITGTTLKGGNLAGPGIRPLVAGADGTIDDQDAAAFRTTIGAGTSSLTLGETSASAYRGDRGKTAYDHSQLTTGNPHGTTAADVWALAKITLTGTIDSQAINGGAPGLYDLHGSVYTNFPGSWSASAGGTLLQTVAKNGRILQELHSEINGKMIQAQTGPTTWSGWTRIWDNGILPVSTTGLAVVTASSQAAARAAIGLAQAEILIHSDFGRSATTDVWQSAFTNNAASGLQLAANTTATGTEITIEQVVDIPADGGAAAYQVYIGPQLTGEQSPTGSTYSDVIDPSGAGEYGAGKIQIRIELIGSGTSIVGYVSSRFETGSSNAPFVRIGQITVNGTIANSIDVRFNPDSQTAYVIRRNRVFRRNP